MAFSAAMVGEVRGDGSDTNGGGWATGSTGNDYSTQAAAQYSLTNGTTNGTTTIATVTAAAVMVGNLVYVAGGTGLLTAIWKQIISVVVGVSITVDSTTGLGASTGVTLNIGGALLSPAVASGLGFVVGNTVYVKAGVGTYTINTNTSNVAGGTIAFSVVTVTMIGYTSTRSFGNTDTPPLFQTSGSTIAQIRGGSRFWNITFDGNSQTTSQVTSSGAHILNSTIKNFTTSSTASLFINCLITGNSGACVGTSIYCEAYANTATPINGTAFRCLSYLNTGSTTDGFVTGNIQSHVECHSVANGRDGFRGGAGSSSCVNCHAQSNTGWGYRGGAAGQLCAINCTGWNNTLGLIDTALLYPQLSVTSTGGDVYVDVANNNYALNNTFGRLLRGGGRLPVSQLFARGLTTCIFDIGGVGSRAPWTGDRGFGG